LLKQSNIGNWCAYCFEILGIAFIYKAELNKLSILYDTHIYYKEHLKKLINIADLWEFDAKTIVNYLDKPKQ
jgi:hypothetical protein